MVSLSDVMLFVSWIVPVYVWSFITVYLLICAWGLMKL